VEGPYIGLWSNTGKGPRSKFRGFRCRVQARSRGWGNGTMEDWNDVFRFLVLKLNTETRQRGISRLANTRALGDAHQFGERLRLHFFHDARAMNFYGLFHGSKLEGNLFIQQTSDDQRHHFALARS
jgi:hypothetical protein